MSSGLLAAAVEQATPDSTIYRWVALVLLQVTTFAGLLITYLVNKKDARGLGTTLDVVNDKADVAATAAQEAKEAIQPVSNGFATKTTDGLASIQQMIRESRGELHELRGLLVSHIADHASSDLRKKDERN